MVTQPPHQRRIETAQAKELRNARKQFATPGGFHDKMIKFLGAGLPMAVGVLAAFMVITPLGPRGEISFLLDRNKVEVVDDRLRVDNALYRGQDNKQHPFSLTAGEAVQRSSAEGVVRMNDLMARIILPEGPARLSARTGNYNIESEIMSVNGAVQMNSAEGYRMDATDVAIDLETRQVTGPSPVTMIAPGGFAVTAAGVSVDLDTKRMTGTGGVTGSLPGGTFRSNRMTADLEARTVLLEGNARLRLVPGS
ncbi:LPS export ABC transporter periplasmic protein LptC [Sphingomonadaceae bacterium]|nr:LPS export ABC transporter periplasmic protein LptC [Sphingomonadaceae bacterium]